ncbi:MAG: CPBP family intramembrane glutamic endopeptidase [Bacillota bacterium]
MAAKKRRPTRSKTRGRERRISLIPARPRGYRASDLLILYALFMLINRSVHGLFGFPAVDRPVSGAAAIIVHSSILALVSYIYLVRYAGDDVGWSGPSRLQVDATASPVGVRLAWVLVGGGAVWLASTAGVRALVAAMQRAGAGLDPWELGTVGQLIARGHQQGFWPFLLLIVGVVVAAPLGEELLFRRCFYQIIIEGLGGQTLAVAGSGLLFAFTHGEPMAMLRAALAGVTYAYAYRQTHSVTVCVLMHAVFNVLALMAVVLDWGPWFMP